MNYKVIIDFTYFTNISSNDFKNILYYYKEKYKNIIDKNINVIIVIIPQMIIRNSAKAYLYFNKLRMHAVESGGETWWSEFRVLHAVLYLCATIYAFQGKRIAWIPLAIDVVIGLLLFLNNHFG